MFNKLKEFYTRTLSKETANFFINSLEFMNYKHFARDNKLNPANANTLTQYMGATKNV